MLEYRLGSRMVRAASNGSEAEFSGEMYLLVLIPEMMLRLVSGDGRVVSVSVRRAGDLLELEIEETAGPRTETALGMPHHTLGQMWEQLWVSLGKPKLADGHFLSGYDGALLITREDGKNVSVRLRHEPDGGIRVSRVAE